MTSKLITIKKLSLTFFLIFSLSAFSIEITNDLSFSEFLDRMNDGKNADYYFDAEELFFKNLESNKEIISLEKELKAQLQKRGLKNINLSISHHYSSTGGDPISVSNYAKVLKESLQEVKEIPVTNLKNRFKDIRFTSGVKLASSGDRLEIPMPFSKGLWYGFLSKEGRNHPKFQDYFESSRAKALNEVFKNSANTSEADKGRLKFLIEKICSNEVSVESKIESENLFKGSDIEVDLYDSKFAKLSSKNRDYSLYYKARPDGTKTISLYRPGLSRTEPNSYLLTTEINLDKNCQINDGKIFTYRDGSKHLYQTFDPSGNLYTMAIFNPDFVLNENVNCVGENKSASEILRLGKDVNKAIIALLDTGVDYNDSSINNLLAKTPSYLGDMEKRALLSTERMQQELLELEQLSWPQKMFMTIQGSNPKSSIESIRNTIEKNNNILEKIQDIRNQSPSFVGKDYHDMDDRPFDYFDGGMFSPSIRRHGTSMARIIGKSQNDISILNVKYPQNGDFQEQRMREAIDYSINFGADVINMSFGIYESVGEEIKKAIQDNKNVLFVSAAGNYESHDKSSPRRDLENEPIYPAVLQNDNHISVANLNSDGRSISNISRYNNKIVEIGAYSNEATSGSAAEISRIAGRIKKICPSFNGIMIKDHLLQTADHVNNLRPYIKDGAVVNEDNAILKAQEVCK